MAVPSTSECKKLHSEIKAKCNTCSDLKFFVVHECRKNNTPLFYYTNMNLSRRKHMLNKAADEIDNLKQQMKKPGVLKPMEGHYIVFFDFQYARHFAEKEHTEADCKQWKKTYIPKRPDAEGTVKDVDGKAEGEANVQVESLKSVPEKRQVPKGNVLAVQTQEGSGLNEHSMAKANSSQAQPKSTEGEIEDSMAKINEQQGPAKAAQGNNEDLMGQGNELQKQAKQDQNEDTNVEDNECKVQNKSTQGLNENSTTNMGDMKDHTEQTNDEAGATDGKENSRKVKKNKKKRRAEAFPPSSRVCSQCQSEGKHGKATYGPAGSSGPSEAVYCSNHKLKKYIRVAYGGTGGRNENVDLKTFVEEGKGTANQYYYSGQKKVKTDLELMAYSYQQQNEQLINKVHHLNNVAQTTEAKIKQQQERIASLEQRLKDAESSFRCTVETLKSTNLALSRAEYEINEYKRLYEGTQQANQFVGQQF